MAIESGPSIIAALVFVLPKLCTSSRILTPIVRSTSLVDALPVWFQWYMRPTGDLTIFTLLPWAGFVFAGGALGALMAMIRDDRSERRLQMAVATVGTGLIVLGLYAASLPTITLPTVVVTGKRQPRS